MYKIQNIINHAITEGIDNLSYQQEKVVSAITKCKTEKMGGHTATCEDCGHETIHYNSCRNRHCPCWWRGGRRIPRTPRARRRRGGTGSSRPGPRRRGRIPAHRHLRDRPCRRGRPGRRKRSRFRGGAPP